MNRIRSSIYPKPKKQEFIFCIIYKQKKKIEKTLRYATRGIPSWKEFASVFIERYVVIPRPTRAGAIDNFIQNDAHDKTTHFYGFRIEFRSTSIFRLYSGVGDPQ